MTEKQKFSFPREAIEVGDIVTPITPAGLRLADVPVNGDYYQKRNDVCGFKGKGKVLKEHKVIIDYDEWSEQDRINEIGDFYGLGKIEYTDYLIECDAGIGWGGGVTKNKSTTS
jgi:hypothetical protein